MSTNSTAFEEVERALRKNNMHHASVRLEQLGTTEYAVVDPEYWTLSAVYALLILDISQVEHSLSQAENFNGWNKEYFLDLAEIAVSRRFNRRMPYFRFFQRREDLYRTKLDLELARLVDRYRTS